MKKIATILMLVAVVLLGGMSMDAKSTKKKTKAKSTAKSKVIIPDGVYEISPMNAPGFALDLNADEHRDANNVQIYQKNDTPAQMWYVKNIPGGKIQIISWGDFNYVIDNSAFRLVNGNNIFIWHKNGEINQEWIPEKVGSGLYVLRTAQDPNFVIDSGGEARNGCNVHLWNYEKGLNNQIWKFKFLFSEWD